MSDELNGKMAKIICSQDELLAIGIKDMFPEMKVKIMYFDVDHIVYGKVYKVYDSFFGNYLIPLKYLEIQK